MSGAYCALVGLLALTATGNLVTNGDFEQGTAGWMLQHGWYEKPQGAGLSPVTVAPGEGRGGGAALKFVGQGKRALAMQAFPVNPGKYRVTGAIKCEGLAGVTASLLCEWMSADNKWLRGDTAGSVSGTRDWQAFDTVVEAPAGARSVHFDLLTGEPNSGTAWFDDISVTRVPSGFPAPQPPAIDVAPAPGAEGALRVSWDPKSLTPGAVSLVLYCEEKRLPAEAVPAEVVDCAAGEAVLQGLVAGHSYQVAAATLNGDGEGSARSTVVAAQARDLQAPRPGFVTAEAVAGGVRVGWSPHLLDTDLKKLTFCLPGEGDRAGQALKTLDVAKLRAEARPLQQTEAWVTAQLTVPAGTTRVGAFCEDQAGNVGSPAFVAVTPQPAAGTLEACGLEVVAPTVNIARQGGPTVNSSPTFSLTLMPGQAKGFQVVLHPGEALHHVRVQFQAPRQENGKASLPSRCLAWHFVNYVRLEKNSIATPKEELVWPGPADYPDELSDDLQRDLPAGQTQPLFIRVSTPPTAAPGKYLGKGAVVCDEGRREFDFSFTVVKTPFPAKPRLPFVYWFSWEAPCRELGVSTTSADGWRVLYEIGRLMRAYDERVVVVPWSLVRTWRRDDGTLSHDFRSFDRFLATFRAAGVDQLFCLSHMGGRSTGEWACPTMSSNRQAVRDARTGAALLSLDVIELLPALQAHIEQLGLLDRFCVHVADEPIKENVASYRELSARVHAAAPKLPRIDAIHVPDLQGSLEHWVPQINYFEQWLPEYRKARAAGNKIWFYLAWVPQGKFPNRMIDGSAIKPRVLHWLNGLYDTDGYLHWALNHWQIPLTSLDSPGDQYITWPSKRFVANSSLRYEAEREGLDDCELMFLLRDHYMKKGLTREQAQAKMERLGRRAVRDFTNYARSWDELEAVRGEMLRELERK